MAARSSSGSSRIRMKWAGTMKVRVPRWRSTSPSHDRASNCSVTTVVAPTYRAHRDQPRWEAW